MKDYWDSSALVRALTNLSLRRRLRRERGFTRTHALAEIFSTLTSGRMPLRVDADRAAEILERLAKELDFVDLTHTEVLDAMKVARARGVRGGRIHDFLHARAAEKAQVTRVLTTDRFDFVSLAPGVTIELV